MGEIIKENTLKADWVTHWRWHKEVEKAEKTWRIAIYNMAVTITGHWLPEKAYIQIFPLYISI